MRKSRYSEEKIIRVLEQVEGGQKVCAIGQGRESFRSTPRATATLI